MTSVAEEWACQWHGVYLLRARGTATAVWEPDGNGRVGVWECGGLGVTNGSTGTIDGPQIPQKRAEKGYGRKRKLRTEGIARITVADDSLS